jgi:hypothetical protein
MKYNALKTELYGPLTSVRDLRPIVKASIYNLFHCFTARQFERGSDTRRGRSLQYTIPKRTPTAKHNQLTM